MDYPAVAYHVAAHIVMQLQLGRRVYYASRFRNDEHDRCTEGELESPERPFRRDALSRVAVERDALYRIAGHAFERHCLGWSSEWSSSRLTGMAAEDKTAVRRVLAPLNLTQDAQDLSIRYVEEKAGRMLADQDVIYRVTRFAQALMEYDYLTDATIMRLAQTIDSVFPDRQRLRSESRLARTRRVTDAASPVLRPSPLHPPGESFRFQPRVVRAVEPRPTLNMSRVAHTRPAAEHDVTGTPLSELGLSNLALNTLRKRGGIYTIEMLMSYSEDALLRIRTLGTKTLAEIRDTLTRAGYNPRW